MKIACKKFRELLPVHSSHPNTSLTRPVDMYVYSSCMRSAMLHTSQTWPLTKRNLQSNDRAMIRQIDLQYQAGGCGHCKVKRATGKA